MAMFGGAVFGQEAFAWGSAVGTVDPIIALGDATLFTLPPDGAFPITLAREWLTDVQRPAVGLEVRAAMRSVPIRRLAFTSTLLGADDLALFRRHWYGATERLRFLVPLWPESSIATAFPTTSTITVDTTNRAFVLGGLAVLWQPADPDVAFEVVTIATLASGSVGTAAPVVGTFTPGVALLVPIMPAWLEPPTKEQLAVIAGRLPLAFTEELPGISGIDPTSGVGVSPTGATLVVTLEYVGSPWAGRRFFTYQARSFDASSQHIVDPVFTWTVTATGDLALSDPGVRLSFPLRRQQVHLEYNGDADATFHVHVVFGALSVDFDIGG
jgi:hypothetical protein